MRLETPGTRGWFRPPHLGQAHGAFKPCTAHFAAWPVPFRNADPLTLFNQHERATELRRRRPMADERYEQRQRNPESDQRSRQNSIFGDASGMERDEGRRSFARSEARTGRSEEQTSELQSLMRNSYAVF